MKLKIALCTIARLENRYIREYITYYKNLGISKIFLYDNNDIGGEDLSQPISDYISQGFVELIDYREGHEFVQVVLDAYTDCYNKHNHEFDWICFFDPDEYLTFMDETLNLQSYLNMKIFKPYYAIHVNWMLYGDNEQLYDTGEDLNVRFTMPCDYNLFDNRQIKSIVRCGLRNIIFKSPHYPILPGNCISCDSIGNICLNKHMLPYYTYKYVALKHFRTKTVSEYVLNKLPKLTLSGYNKIDFDDGFFFTMNTYTKEKHDLLLKLVNPYLYKNYNDHFSILPKKQLNYKKYSFLTVYTNVDYPLYEIKEKDPYAEYICVTTIKNLKSDTWNIVYDEKLVNEETNIKFKYPKFHPFEYVNTDYCIYLDSKIQILNNYSDFIQSFINSEYLIGNMTHQTRYRVIDELKQWNKMRNLDIYTVKQIEAFYNNVNFYNTVTGLFFNSLILYKNTEITKTLCDTQWQYMLIFGNGTDVLRTDQVLWTYVMWEVFNNDINEIFKNILILSPNLVISDMFNRENTPKVTKNIYNVFNKVIMCYNKVE